MPDDIRESETRRRVETILSGARVQRRWKAAWLAAGFVLGALTGLIPFWVHTGDHASPPPDTSTALDRPVTYREWAMLAGLIELVRTVRPDLSSTLEKDLAEKFGIHPKVTITHGQFEKATVWLSQKVPQPVP